MKKEDVLTRDCHDKPAVLSDYAWDRLAISSKCFVFDLSVPNTIVLSIKVHLLKQRPSKGERECAGGARGTVFGRGAVLTAGAVDRQVPHRVQARSSRAPEDIFLRQHAISDGGRGQRRVHALERRQRRKKTCPGRANTTLIYKWRQLV